MRFIKKVKRYLGDVVRTVSKVERSKGSRLKIFCDIIYCQLRFHVSFREYLLYQFYNYKNCYRKNFMLKYHQVHKYKRVNNAYITFSKYGFYEKVSEFFQREIILLPSCGEQKFLDFVKKHDTVILKPNKGSGGKGIRILKYENDEQILQCFRDIKRETVCEELIRQHKVLSDLNPYSVNTLRIVSLRHDENNIEIISATLKSGARYDSFVDNLSSGGIIALVDIESGIVSTFGVDANGKHYTHHPITETQIIGMNIPYWSKAIALIKNAHRQLNENRILGWDIAITETGVDIVEANSAPGPNIMQMADLVPKGEKILKVLNNKKNQVYKFSFK